MTTAPATTAPIAPWDIGLFGTRTSGGKPYVVAVVGAASGIGRAAASFLAEIGCTVAALDPALDGLKSLAAEKPEIRIYNLDALNGRSINESFAAVTRDLGAIDALVNCAGITGKTNIPAHEVPLEDFDRVLALNLRAAMMLSQAVLPGMLKRGYGRLLHVASIAGKEGNAGMASYSTSKAGLIGLVKSMGKDYAEFGRHGERPGARRHPHPPGRGPAPGDRGLHDGEDPHAPLRRAGGGGGLHRLDRLAGLRLHHRLHLRSQRRPGDLLNLARGIE